MSVEFDREDVAFAVRSHLCTVQIEGIVRCATLVRHLAVALNLAAARIVHPSVALEKVLGFARSMVWCALSVTNP